MKGKKTQKHTLTTNSKGKCEPKTHKIGWAFFLSVQVNGW